jgi:translation initiation factor 4G
VLLAASRSHLPKGPWDFALDRDEIEILDLLAKLTVRGPEHLFHYGRFVIAELDGQPAAALSGYDPVAHGVDVLMPTLLDLFTDLGWTDADVDALLQRHAAVITPVMAVPPTGAWVVESVATAPEYRRRGLIDHLLPVILDRGRRGGHTVAQISVLIGNEPARRAYVKHGFRPESEGRSPEFETAMGCPGIEHLRQPL